MNTRSITTLLLSSSFLFACTSAPADDAESTRSAVSAPGGDQCVLITNADLADLRATLEAGLALSELDAAANGPGGAYGTAAYAARDSFAAAIGIVDEYQGILAASQYDGDPDVTGAWEGSQAGGYAWQILENLQQAVHWGSVSAIYHTSEEARSAIEEAFRAIEMAGELRAHGQRCYVDAYFPG